MSTSSISFHVWGMRATRESWWYRRTKGEQGCVSRNPLLRLPAAWFCRIIIVADIAIGLYTTVNGPANDFWVTLAFPTIPLSDRSTAMRSITPIYYRLLGRILWSRDWFGFILFCMSQICPTKRIHSRRFKFVALCACPYGNLIDSGVITYFEYRKHCRLKIQFGTGQFNTVR